MIYQNFEYNFYRGAIMVEFNRLDYKISDNKKSKNEILDKFKNEKFFVKGFLDSFSKISILWVINRGKINGYELMNEINDMFSIYIENDIIKPMTPSKTYPILHKIENKGIIEGFWESQGKRKSKYYNITPKGEKLLKKLKNITKENNNPIFQELRKDMILK